MMEIKKMYHLQEDHQQALALAGKEDPAGCISLKEASGNFGRYQYSRFSTARFSVTTQVFILNRPAAFLLLTDKISPCFVMALSGSIQIDKPFHTLLAKGQFNFLCSNTKEMIYRFDAGKTYTILNIFFLPSYFSLHSEYYFSVYRFFSSAASGEDLLMSGMHGLAGYAMQCLAEKVCGAPKLKGEALFLEAAIDNLLLLAIAQMTSSKKQMAVETDDFYTSIYKAGEAFIMEPDNRYSIRGLARKMNMNPNKLKIEFKKTFRMPPKSFLTKLRMEKARQLLLDTDMKVQDISLSVGYSNPGHFSNVFRNKMGSSPSALRKENLKNHPRLSA